MRVSIIALLACSVLAATAGLSCAEQGLPAAATLGDMGLSGLQVISDDEALDIRGFGYDPWHGYGRHAKHGMATAYGRSWAQIAYKGASAGTEDGFAATGKHLAQGEHGSEAGIVIKHYYGKGKTRRGGRRGGGGEGGPAAQATNGGGNGSYGGGKGHGGGHPPKPKAKSARVFAGGFSIGITK